MYIVQMVGNDHNLLLLITKAILYLAMLKKLSSFYFAEKKKKKKTLLTKFQFTIVGKHSINLKEAGYLNGHTFVYLDGKRLRGTKKTFMPNLPWYYAVGDSTISKIPLLFLLTPANVKLEILKTKSSLHFPFF